jgi:hypothetical protein
MMWTHIATNHIAAHYNQKDGDDVKYGPLLGDYRIFTSWGSSQLDEAGAMSNHTFW